MSDAPLQAQIDAAHAYEDLMVRALSGEWASRVLFDEAGIAPVGITSGTGTARFPSVRVMVEADLRGWLRVMGIALPKPLIARIIDEAEAILKPYVTADGTVVFDTAAHIITATRPSNPR